MDAPTHFLTQYGLQPIGVGTNLSKVPIGHHFDTFVDLGCGGGRSALYLAIHRKATFKKIYGIDLNKELLNSFEKIAKDHAIFGDAELHLMDCSFTKLPVDSNSIDFVSSYTAFHTIGQNSFNAGVKEASRIIKPNGFLHLGNARYATSQEQVIREAMEGSEFPSKGGYVLDRSHNYWHIENQAFKSLIRFWSKQNLSGLHS